MISHRLLVPFGVVAVIATTPALASAAAWGTLGSGSARASAGSLDAPTTVSAAAASATTVTISVTAGPAAPSATPSGYRVDRVTAPALSGACYITGTTGSCAASAVGTGSNQYRVYSWIGPDSSNPGWVSSTFTAVSGSAAATLAAPTGLTATRTSSGNNVSATWDAVSGATSYECLVQVGAANSSPAAGATWSTADGCATRNYSKNGAANGTGWFFVRATAAGVAGSVASDSF